MQFLTRVALIAAALVPAVARIHTAYSPLASADPCPFGYGTNCGGGAPLTAATKNQVANILEGILTKLTSHKALVQHSQKVLKANNTEVRTAKNMPVPVRGALQSLLTTMRKSGKASEADVIGHMISDDSPDVGCTYFGACGKGSNRPIDSQTKAQVASILEGILKNLSSHN